MGPRIVDTLTTDLQHFLDEDGAVPDLPAPARALITFLGAITAWVTVRDLAYPRRTNVACRWRKARGTCPGTIDATYDTASGAIFWTCPDCGDEGTILGWEGTLWDRRDGSAG